MLKVKIETHTPKSLEEIKQINLRKAKAAFAVFPIATKVWLCMKTGLTMEFIKNNWDEITKL